MNQLAKSMLILLIFTKLRLSKIRKVVKDDSKDLLKSKSITNKIEENKGVIGVLSNLMGGLQDLYNEI